MHCTSMVTIFVKYKQEYAIVDNSCLTQFYSAIFKHRIVHTLRLDNVVSQSVESAFSGEQLLHNFSLTLFILPAMAMGML